MIATISFKKKNISLSGNLYAVNTSLFSEEAQARFYASNSLAPMQSGKDKTRRQLLILAKQTNTGSLQHTYIHTLPWCELLKVFPLCLAATRSCFRLLLSVLALCSQAAVRAAPGVEVQTKGLGGLLGVIINFEQVCVCLCLWGLILCSDLLPWPSIKADTLSATGPAKGHWQEREFMSDACRHTNTYFSGLWAYTCTCSYTHTM